uniref:Protein kinase domain-containing protein n=1 Tax=Odontella aurita TaxID=265563 RepID=A0A7S4N6Q8_9STRA|mmetsp:Transcript_49795/g.149794  ORF Transcript_49795/g.149794 Transcript_49795/m.149794 type:complete len:381 (+) Transcript_49795:89-1231(+)
MTDQHRVGNFVLGEEIGRGTFSRVLLGTHVPTGRRVAVKVIDKARIDGEQSDVGRRVRREISALLRCDHHHVLRLFDVAETPDEILLVTEYAGGGSLFRVMNGGRTPPLEEARRIFQQILCGVAHCHERGVAHRDLKPENILLDDRCSSFKLGDFGFCGVVPSGEGWGGGDGGGRRMQTPCGTPDYAAPEVIAGRPYDGRAADVWSCGVLLYALLTGSVPFKGASTPELLKKIAAGKFIMPFQLPQDAKRLIKGMLEVDPAARITVPQILNRPWFQTRLPVYLCTLPDTALVQGTVLDREIVDRVVQMASEEYSTTPEIVEMAMSYRNDNGGQIPEELRNARCAYCILLDETRACMRARETSWTAQVSTQLHDAIFKWRR